MAAEAAQQQGMPGNLNPSALVVALTVKLVNNKIIR